MSLFVCVCLLDELFVDMISYEVRCKQSVCEWSWEGYDILIML